jgi:protein gp37
MPARDWWDDTWNPVGGCFYVSTGCRICFALPRHLSHTHKVETVHTGVSDINEKGQPIWNARLTVLPDDHHAWNFPLKEYRGAKHPKLGPGKPSLILVACTSDLFIEGRPLRDIARVVETMALSEHIGLFLSKYTGPKKYRGQRYQGQMAPYFLSKSPLTVECWRRNIWLGFSAERQREFDFRWEDMRPLAEAGWFVYACLAPLLEPITLPPDFLALAKWVIVNGEGEQPKLDRCRNMDPMWARSVRDQCAEAGIPFFLRGMAKGAPRPPDLRIRQFPSVP